MVKVKRLNRETNCFDEVEVEGMIVSKFTNDIDHGDRYRVSISNVANPTAKKKFVDISVDKEYYEARFKFLERMPQQKTALDVLHDKKKIAADNKDKNLRLKAAKELKQRKKDEEDATRRKAIQGDNIYICNFKFFHVV